jgi:hypothetical protein
MQPAKTNKVKVTYTWEQRTVLLLKEAFQRDLQLFKTLLESAPRDWTFTTLSDGTMKELVVNIPAKKK